MKFATSCAALALALACTITIGNASAQTAPLKLESDTRLSRKITIEVTGEPLADVLKSVSDGRLALQCGRDCADMKVQIRLIGRPLSDLVQALAGLLPGTGTATLDNSGYRLEMSDEAVHRRERWWRLYVAERGSAFAAQCDAILAALKAGPDRRVVEPNPLEPSDPRIAEEQIAHHGLFSSLPAAFQVRLANNFDDGAFYRVGGNNWFSNDDEGAIALGLHDLAAPVADAIQKRAASIAFARTGLDFDHSLVYFSNSITSIKASVYFPDGTTCGDAFSFSAEPVPALAAAYPEHTMLVRLTEEVGKAAPFAWKELTAYHKSRVWPNDPPRDPKAPRQWHSRQADLDWLGRVAGIEYVADYYSHGGSPILASEKNTAISGGVEEQLNFQAARHDQSWKKQPDSIYLVRNNRWYRDDRLEAPEPLLHRWYGVRQKEAERAKRADLARPGPAEKASAADRIVAVRNQLDFEAEVVTSLSRWQVENGFSLYMPDDNTDEQRKRFEESGHASEGGRGAGRVVYSAIVLHPFAEDAAHIHSQYRTDLFYASLDGEKREALIERRLPYAALNADQKRLAALLTPGLAAALEGTQADDIRLALAPHDGMGARGWYGIGPMRLAVVRD